MTRTLSIASLVLSASAACAQTVDLIIDIEQPILEYGRSTRVTLMAGFSTGDYALAGILTDVVAVDTTGDTSGSWSDWELVAPMDGPGTSAGAASGRYDITGIIAGQLNFPPAMIYADPSNPIALWQATFTVGFDGPGIIDFATRTSRLDMYPLRESGLSESRLDVLVEGSGQIFIAVPAPTSGAVLIVGLAATRRRR